MSNKIFQRILIFIFLGALVYSCTTRSDQVNPLKGSNNPSNVSDSISGANGINPLRTIPGNNIFNTTLGSINLQGLYNDKVISLSGRCDTSNYYIDSVTSSYYYIISGKFGNGKDLAFFSVYFNQKPSQSGAYKILPFPLGVDSIVIPALWKQPFTNSDAYVVVTDVSKTGKTWRALTGDVNVVVQDNVPRIYFTNIKGANIANITDTLFFDGNMQCQ